MIISFPELELKQSTDFFVILPLIVDATPRLGITRVSRQIALLAAVVQLGQVQVNEAITSLVVSAGLGGFWRTASADFDSAMPRFESWRPSQVSLIKSSAYYFVVLRKFPRVFNGRHSMPAVPRNTDVTANIAPASFRQVMSRRRRLTRRTVEAKALATQNGAREAPQVEKTVSHNRPIDIIAAKHTDF